MLRNQEMKQQQWLREQEMTEMKDKERALQEMDAWHILAPFSALRSSRGTRNGSGEAKDGLGDAAAASASHSSPGALEDPGLGMGSLPLLTVEKGVELRILMDSRWPAFEKP